MPDAPIVIAGAGLAGPLTALLLARRAHRVVLLERRSDMRRVTMSAGRSINLALSTRGRVALAEVGLEDVLVGQAIPMSGRMMHAHDGARTFQPYGRTGEAILSVSRRDLNVALLDAAERAGVEVRFDQRVTDVDLETGAASVEHADGTHTRLESRLLIGADGAFSAVRMRMMRHGRFSFSQTYLEHGYKELTMPPAADGGFRMEPNALHIWPRREFMMIALPNRDHTFTCTLFLPHEGPISFAALRDPEAFLAFVAREFPDAIPHLPGLAGDLRDNAVGDLAHIRCQPFHAGGRVALVGDAAHAVVPFYGQGMNAAFESALLLDRALATHADPGEALAAYSRARKPDADAISDLALHNFFVMRDHVADGAFLRRKALEHVLEQVFPETYRSLYGMVTFSTLPYAEAARIARAETEWIDRVEAGGSAELAGLLALAWIRHLSA